MSSAIVSSPNAAGDSCIQQAEKDVTNAAPDAANEGEATTNNSFAANHAADGEPASALSKSQLRKIRKQKRFEERKQQRKEQRKLKQLQQKQAKRARVEEMTEEERQLCRQIAQDRKQTTKQQTAAINARMDQALISGMKVVYDLAFWHLMNDAEKMSMRQQLMYSYSINRHATQPCHMVLTDCNEELLTIFNQHISGFDRWKVTHTPQPYITHFAACKDDLVYLSADAEDELLAIDPQKIYIIGAFVDRNRHKNICANKAQEQGIAMARLPIQRYVQMKAATVLTVNQVTDILVKQRAYDDWQRTLDEVLPLRKVKQGGEHDVADGNEKAE